IRRIENVRSGEGRENDAARTEELDRVIRIDRSPQKADVEDIADRRQVHNSGRTVARPDSPVIAGAAERLRADTIRGAGRNQAARRERKSVVEGKSVSAR